ncbi:MAG: protein translocase subunit SecF [Clostridia bacterium]|nr:protein translocase subunit SecF [Clostridia bacterium]
MVDLMGKKFYFFGLSVLIIITGIIGLIVHDGFNLDIQFQGGTILKMRVTPDSIDDKKADEYTLDNEKIINIVQKQVGIKPDVQKGILPETKNGIKTGKSYVLAVINIPNSDKNVSDEKKVEKNKLAKEELVKEFKLDPSKAFESEDTVEPFIGKELLQNGLIATLVASLLIILYIWIRFKVMSGLSAGVMAVIGLLHDIMIMLAVYSVLNIKMNESFIAAVLTIMGYSMNDTIIIYDRIRENSAMLRKIPVAELANRSIMQTLARSINTVVTVLICCITMYVFASINHIESIKEFSLPLTVGIASGCYSSIFVATPLWVMWKERQQKKRVGANTLAKSQ